MSAAFSSGRQCTAIGAVWLCLLGGGLGLSPVQAQPAPVQNLGQAAYDRGIYFDGSYTGQVAANPVGGERQGSAYNGQLLIGSTLDMGKLAGIPGGFLHVTFTSRTGENLSATSIDSDGQVQRLYGGDMTYQLSTFTYEQAFFKKKLDLTIGRMALSNTFARSSLYCAFQSNYTCGNPFALSKTINRAAFPIAVWGGTLLLAPAPNIYAKFGVFQVDPSVDPASTHGFDWSTANSTGFTVPVEAGYQWRTPGAMDFNRYDIGTVLDRSEFSTETPFGEAYHTPTSNLGRQVIYLQAQQLVWQAAPGSKRGVYVFTSDLYGASGSKQSINWNWNVGAVWQGPFASRADDHFAIGMGGSHYNNAFLQALYKTRVAAGGTEFPDQWMYFGEVNYAIQATNWLALIPNMQWMINPNGLGFATYAAKNVPSAVTFGIQFNIGLTQLLGLPRKS